MSDCPFSQQLGAYHDGELDAQGRAAVERHLQQCSVCAAELAQLRALSGLFASAQQPRLSQISMHRLHRRVDVIMDEGIVRIARFTSAAAAAVLLVCSILLADGPNDRSSAPVDGTGRPCGLGVG